MLLGIALKIVACLFITDFLSGFFHWLEDSYGQEDWPIIGEWITQPNILHHRDCRYFTKHSWFHSARVLLIMGAVILVTAYFCGFLHWMTVLVVLIGVNANEIHKWTHRTEAENGRLITILQKLHLIQTPSHHFVHHRGGKDTHYCVVTDFLNPLLDAMHFWEFLEKVAFLLFRVRRREDKTIME